MNSNFAPIGRITTDVIYDLASRRKAKLGVGCGLPAFKSALAEVTAEKELRDAARKQNAAKWDYSQQGRALITKGVAMLRDAEGENACDEWLTKCMSKGE